MANHIVRVTEENHGLLVEYCAQHGPEHDGSFLPGRDFELTEEYPSYLLVEGSQAAGAVSLMRTKNFLSIGKGRFSIFHARSGEASDYAKLLEAIRPQTLDLKSAYMFIPEENRNVAGILESLGFKLERYSFILERRGSALPAPIFPEGIDIYALAPDDSEGIRQFAECINEEFKDLAGHTHSTAEFIQTFFEDQGYIEGGVCLLRKGQEPIGTIGLMHDLEDLTAGELMALGILEKYRGKDLGRNLFRYGVNFLIKKGLNPVILSVNGENHRAIRLYQSEGFMLTSTVVCYSLEP